MVSRVAAVKAPRTYNRRRVTGSSGRRREGRESEPQRPNMSRRVFTSAVLLLLVVMLCCGSGAASSKDMPSSSQGASSEKYYVWTEKKGGETVGLLRVPGLVEMNGEVFAVAEAQLKGESDFNGIASELLTLTGQESKELVTAQVKTQVLVACPSDKKNCASREAALAVSQSEKRAHVSRPTTVVKGSDIYMLAGKYCQKPAAAGAGVCEADEWGLLLVKGQVSGNGGSSKGILWKETNDVPPTTFVKEPQSLTRLIGGGGSGVHTGDGTFLFPVEATKEDEKTVSLILYSKDTKSWKLSNWMSADGCGDPSVVEWKDGKLMMMTACDDGRRRVYESGDKGESWTEALGTLSRVWGNKHKLENVKGVRSGFITAKIEDRDVMLVTLPVHANKADKEVNVKGRLHLWLTDNTHIVDIGPVSVEGDDEVAASSLLYKSGDNNELIALYEKKKGGEEESLGMVSVRLTEQLKRVKDVLKTWKDVDSRVFQLCTTSLVQKAPSPDTACSAGKITAGLVGFLSGNFSEDTWRDEYLGVNATVKNGAAAKAEPSDGVKFTGRGAGAEWPVGAQGENQLYHFANYNFTLVATVSIDGVPKGDTPIPLMGVNMKGEQGKFFGLSYEKERKWMLLCGDGTTNSGELSSTGEPGTKRHVVILLRNGNQRSAYVDGQRVGVGASCALGSTESQETSHFYIGGDGGGAEDKESREDVSVTVTNVLLYNRPLSDNEIAAFNPNKVTIQQLKDKSSEPSPVSSDSVDTNASPVTAAAQQTGTSSTPDGKHPTEQGQSMGSSNAGSGSAYTTTVSTITTPAAGEEPVMQVAPRSSSDGHKNVGGGSFSDGDPTVETREGGTNGQEEEVSTQVREVNATALSSSLVNVSQGNNSDTSSMRGSGLLLSLLLLLGLWGLAAL
ncbi:putative trans-sialidase, Group V [Trypanosoma cruzi]|uniref:Trans-sialidase, putative n=2 Tax=Trypanosoma cruzi TaxID=5693 RepID=Q4DFV5_TRYCC|nr:trans-sialidase, putative [Trypanosoma cruzi]EAN91406.1 trans-sialidase, putative [Trypanosoma cruzi]PWV14207.1 putative trans-sialidase, Group V [Trypanosoma cruzi]RNC40366.1 c71 surface protein [Trypanosoma cruzi]|eukprot:XP_813257.1 trans-sialidase [Trypanosoma cruzi strain CL Brener]